MICMEKTLFAVRHSRIAGGLATQFATISGEERKANRDWRLSYSLYLAVVVSVSQMVTSFTRTRPFVLSFRCEFVSSKKYFARFSAEGLIVSNGFSSLIISWSR